MLDCIARGEAPAGIKAEDVQAAVDRHMPQLKTHKPSQGQGHQDEAEGWSKEALGGGSC